MDVCLELEIHHLVMSPSLLVQSTRVMKGFMVVWYNRRIVPIHQNLTPCSCLLEVSIGVKKGLAESPLAINAPVFAWSWKLFFKIPCFRVDFFPYIHNKVISVSAFQACWLVLVTAVIDLHSSGKAKRDNPWLHFNFRSVLCFSVRSCWHKKFHKPYTANNVTLRGCWSNKNDKTPNRWL